ncbi:exopolyphosphatase PRUNE1 isoform X2 [Plodia interpunctella]|uniref:exopolyphosphatase PRUNE1 isoform X2 n=1 Tax=Plodia interpunctella TaxID=58824 RepID=UPI002368B25F|nr:exopolyphosphatase PRUNE1 isoform X2 [Plodia interpunctella]
MDQYLTDTSNKLRDTNYADLTIVLGNESCDLDSAISSIVYALFLNWQYQQIKCKTCTRFARREDMKDSLFVPILNVDRENFPLKTEVVYFLNEHGINETNLVFRNDYDLKQLVTQNKTNVVLVDHHTLNADDMFLAPYVTEIIDHRLMDKSGWHYKDDTRSTIEIAGSCCTLVSQRIRDLSALVARDVDFFDAYPVCSDMLHSTIILDTVNFSKEFNKATPHDEEIVQFLESLIKPNDYDTARKQILDRLTTAKSNVSVLSASQLLLKDLKIVGAFLVPSFPILVQEFLQKSDAEKAMSSALTQKQCRAIILLGMSLGGGLDRDLAIYSQDMATTTKLSKFFEEWTNPPLMLVPEELPNKIANCLYYKQKNLSATRKQYIPALNEYIITDAT